MELQGQRRLQECPAQELWGLKQHLQPYHQRGNNAVTSLSRSHELTGVTS